MATMEFEDNGQKTVTFTDPEKGWPPIRKAITTLQDFLNNGSEGGTKDGPDGVCSLFTPAEKTLLYTGCFNMCVQRPPHNYSEELYKMHAEIFVEHYQHSDDKDKFSVSLLLKSKLANNEYFLREMLRCWKNHNVMNKWIQKVFQYLDRFYVKFQGLPTLMESGSHIFKMLVYDNFKVEVTIALLTMIDQERNGTLVVDKALVKEVIGMYVDIGSKSIETYNVDFEAPFIEATSTYYQRVAGGWAQELTTAEYLKKVDKVIEVESAHARYYYHMQTEPKVMKAIDEECLVSKLDMMFVEQEQTCRHLLINDCFDDLNRMFRLLLRLPQLTGVSRMADAVAKLVTELGLERVDQQIKLQNPAPSGSGSSSSSSAATAPAAGKKSAEKEASPDDPVYVKDIIALHDRFSDLITAQFQSHNTFQKALRDAFAVIMNRDVGKFKAADLLSSYSDRLLRVGGASAASGSSAGLSEAEIEVQLDKIVLLFSYTQDKDIFSEIYRNQLAKRLLNSKSASDEMERVMIGKLKLKCGTQFTSKMEGMLNDLSVGADHQAQFDAHCSATGVLGKIEMQVNVLTNGNWPTFKVFDSIFLPPIMLKCVKSFQEYYEEKTSHRRLSWQYAHGQVFLRACFGGGKNVYEIQVTTLQAAVLLYFASGLEKLMSMEDIQKMTNIPDEVLKRLLHSLACGKFRILKRSSGADAAAAGDEKANKGIKPTDLFAFNDSFTSPLRKIRVPMSSLEDVHIGGANSASSELQRKLDEDRSVAIEAAIVRIMKIRKQLGHQQLISEVLTQLSFFKPNSRVIKKRIEALIDREYLERDPNNETFYKYLA